MSETMFVVISQFFLIDFVFFVSSPTCPHFAFSAENQAKPRKSILLLFSPNSSVTTGCIRLQV